MENQTNIGNQNAQQIGQNPISQHVQIPEKPRINYWMVSTVLLLFILLMSGAWFVLNTKNRISSDQQPATSNKANQTVVTGVLRTSGLSEEEKQKFGLTTINYQITDFGDRQKAYQEGQVMGYYLLSNAVDDKLLGKCVRVTGTVTQEWKNKNMSDSYNRLALNITNIERIDNSTCNPYLQIPPDIAPTIDRTQEKLVLRGTVVHGKRPAPDINYDYQLQLAEPFVDKLNATGQGPQPQNIVDIVPPDNDIWTKLEENINTEVNVEGYMFWGYAESRYLQIMSVKGVNIAEIVDAVYDENCSIKITFSTKEVINILTDHKKTGIVRCYQVKWISVSPDKKYVAFEGSDWSLPNGGNYLGVYFLSQKDYANLWEIGAATISELTFDNVGNLIAEGTYAGDQSKTKLKFRLKYIEQNFKIIVNPTTKRLPEANDAWTAL